MEDDVVLADEMDETGVLALPPFLPTLRQKFLSVRNISYRSVEPDIKDLAFSSFDRHGNSPVKVAADSPGLKPAVQPRFALAVDIAPPLLVVLEDPFPQPRLVLIQGKVPVGGLLLNRLSAAELGLRVQELFRAESASALLALVPVGVRVATLGAGADYVPVGQEGLRLRVVVLLALHGDELSLVVQLTEELRGVLVMDG